MVQLFRIFCLIGLWLSTLSLREHVAAKAGLSASSFCQIGQSFDCGAVAKSNWSEILGLPLASWGIAFYAVLFIFGLAASREKLVSKFVAASVLLLLSLFSSLFSVFLFSVSYFSVGKLCPLCIGMYLVNFCLFIISLKLIKPATFLASCTQGFKNILRFPAVLAGIGYSIAQKSLARLSVLALAIILFFSSVAENYIKDKIIAPELNQMQLVEAWKVQPSESLQTDTGQHAFADFFKGKSDAAIQIVEFSDFECPSCMKLSKVLDTLIKEYGQSVKLIHKNFPLDMQCNSAMSGPLHLNSCYFSNVARCAGEQEKFWEAAEIIYGLQTSADHKDPAVARQNLLTTISTLGIDMQALTECIDSGRQLEVIKNDIKTAIDLQLDGTPTVWVNNKKFEGRTEQEYRQLLDYMLKN